jgi:6-phosphofructokinase 1
MDPLKGSCIIGQSGGPTAVINASVCGAIITALRNPSITKVYAMQNGIAGLLHEKLFDCGAEEESELSLLTNTPSAALGSCRHKLADFEKDDAEYKRILDIFKKYDVRYFFYNGGNDSMDTCNKISKYMKHVGYDCRIIGIPKTIDNDLAATDHCPGYGSAAKYIATSIAEVSLDSKAYSTGSVILFEIMGRHAGWLTAAAALANEIGEGPDLVYLPEVPFDLDRFVDSVRRIYQQNNKCIVAVSEGVRDAAGRFIVEYGREGDHQTDAFGHKQMGGLCQSLVSLVQARTGFKCRGIELSLLQRAAAHCASKTDVAEAYMVGAAAVENAVIGHTDEMAGFKRHANVKYQTEVVMVPLSEVANREKMVPREWINEEGDQVTQSFIDYALPLIEGEPHRVWEKGLPRYAKLRKVFVEK